MPSTTYKHCSTHQSNASRKYLLYAVLLVFLTFPHSSEEFAFQFGGTDDDGDARNDDGTKQVTKPKRKFEQKFKFRKIERVYVDDYVEDEEENDGDVSTQQNENIAADSSRANEDEEVQFERAHKAQKERRKQNADDAQKPTKQRDQAPASTSFLGNLFGGLFGGDGTKVKTEKPKQSDSPVEQSNNIIDWLKWIGEKIERKPPPPPPEPVKSDTWLSYLNRWPFNSFFPFGQPEKPIAMPRRGAAERSAYANYDGTSHSSEIHEMSQEHFESLLHTLPGFVVNASHVADIECKQQLQIFHRQLRGHKMWTLQMLDATGKMSSGLLRGNINQFGDFDMCTQLKTVVKVTPDVPLRIRGKYCLTHIEIQTSVPALKVPLHFVHGRGLWNSHLGNPNHFVPRYAVANWGICVPHMCSAKVVQDMIETNLRPYNTTGVQFHVEADDRDCSMRESKRFTKLLRKDDKFAVTIFYITALCVLVCATLAHRQWAVVFQFLRSKLQSQSSRATIETAAEEEETVATESSVEEETTDEVTAKEDDVEEQQNAEATGNDSLKWLLREIFFSFSPQRTLQQLLSSDRVDVQFPVFHVLKLGATFMLYICLKYLMIGHLPITNRDKLVRAIDQPMSILFRAPMIYADILLLISGFVSAYQLSEEMEQKSYIQLLKRMASKIARYLPAVYVVLFFQTFVLPHMGAGPLWSNLIGQNALICEQQMWRNMFSVQNAIDFEETCSPMTIQLALEVQLFLLGPLIVWLYHTDADAAFFAYFALHAMSVSARFARTQREHLSVTLFHGMNVSKFYRTANILYSSPISRATPYLLGIGAGLLYRSQDGHLEISPELVPIGWAIAALSLLWCFWSPADGMRSDFIYTSADAAKYASWGPLILGLIMLWLIFMFPKEDNSVLRSLASSRPVLFLSRITFPMQMVMYVVVVYNTASVKEMRQYQLTDLINFAEVGAVLLLATMLAFLIDIPSQNIRRLLVNRIFVERPHYEQEPASEAEQSEQADNASEDQSEHAVCDTPEPTESVWASDPEEEEQKYITRRRSSTVAATENMAAEAATKENSVMESEQAEQVEVEEEEIEEIEEEAEIKKRPATPTAPAAEKEVSKEDATITRRRRRPVNDD